MKRSYLMEALIVIMCVLLLIVAFWEFILINIPAGHKGVLFRPLKGGTVTDRYFDEGLVLIFPWNQIYIYDTRVISGQDTIDALTEDGLQVRAEISYRYRPEADSLGKMHKDLGQDYADKVIVPHVTAATRDVISRYRMDALYTTSRSDIQSDMLGRVRDQVDGSYPITTIDLIVRNIVLEETVEQAIANKLVKEQEMLAYDFIIEKELKEEERKLIEARGIKYFQDTSGINILQWRGIEATEELAKSPNAKVVIIGTDTGELPVILGGN
ncbi:MAG: prohibitin family protein [Phaeodactylibacter sp.]|nr:prohibitin family protein [Phaeodactylibacter sp.]MCB0614596.1 prohibitin family protein [Phaeodactylibacter sp.]MCB9304741.1 prohibitin family protein [Lewinellaceae bacterium]